MDILVLRHGKAESADSGINDKDRALTGKGKDEITRIADWLFRRGGESGYDPHKSS